ncbi:hypothetical protein C2E23DRAFT_833362 [Lenzites betulinus]|nr:hypothetical protein C2E23DRAFT_833362 [Lenzites betulinus]
MDTSGSESQAKRRRQVAFYPNMNSTNKPQKPFSRSAAKRESVMALGSIEYLQHYFTKTGIAAESDPLQKPNSGLRPAIGGLHTLQNRLSAAPNFVLPPSPAMPAAPQISFPPYVKTFETDPESLRPGVIADLITVAAGWRLDPQEQQRAEQDPNLLGVGEKSKASIDVLDLLKNTTRAVRSVRNYLVSLPDDSQVPQTRPHFRPQTLSSSPLPKRQVSQPNSPHDPLTRIRGRALEVLSVLRELEERARLPLDHDAYDAQSDHGSSNDANTAPQSRGTSPSSQMEDAEFLDADTSVSISFIDVGGRQRPVPVWEDEESYDVNNGNEEDKRDHWDERLVLGGGWLYQQDVRIEDLAREREVVSKYVDAVDEVLFGGPKEGRRGWDRERERLEKKERTDRETRAKGRRVSAGDVPSGSGEGSGRSNRRVVSTSLLDSFRGMSVTEEPEEMESVQEEDLIDDDELPPWAKRSTFVDDDYGRLVSLFAALLPGELLRLLPMDSENREGILRALSSGQLLCTAYNTGVRRSRKPWGYVSKDAIHDIAALELAQSAEASGESKRGWTFRRTDNLRLWAAALKLRYSIPLVLPNSKRQKEPTLGSSTPADGNTPLPSPSVSAVSFPGTITDETIVFDAPLVARLEDGWEHTLERAVFKWMDAVVGEKRGER